ncbi:MAG: M17 family peptidase N-terminal domain-containing protein [Myxococcota bacterium]|nr:M17 family peptidase N-terminal domain-containing protein [Myxococcota bacterium]
MSHELVVEVDGTPLERSRADVVAIPIFSGERPLRGDAGRLDWRLCGKLSALVAEERLRGEPGDAALIASFGGLSARRLLVLGGGVRADFDGRAFESLGREATRRAVLLNARSLVLPVAEEHVVRLGSVVGQAAEALAGEQPDRELRLILGVPPEEVTRTADLLRRNPPARVPAEVALRLPVPGERNAPARRAAEDATPRGAQPVK